MTSYPLVRRTLATFLNAELGFFRRGGVDPHAYPARCGQLVSAGAEVFFLGLSRPFLTS